MPRLSDPGLLEPRAYLCGAWHAGAETFPVHNPSTGAEIARVADCTIADLRGAIDRARDAQRDWAAQPAKARAQVLRRWFDLMTEHADDLGRILTAEQGKPLAEAKGEIGYGASFVEWFAEEAKRVYGDVIPGPRADARIMVLKQPVGVVGAITPWNFPNAMIARKAAPALAAGCAFLVRPSELTPLSALAMAVLAERAGVPPGVFSVVTSAEAPAIGEEMCANPAVAKITFTGSTRVGRILMRQSAETVKRMSLELGGNAPFVVFDDADLDAAVDGAMAAKFRNNGQTCICANRFYVQRGVHDAFADKLAARVAALRPGDGMGEGVDTGPLINAAAVDKVEAHIADATRQGARVVTGGGRLEGTFFEPTLLADVPPGAQLTREETFGPVAALIPFDDEAEAIRLANDSEYGLAGYFYARDLSRVWRVAEAMETGMVGINTGLISTEVAPFGGVKQSGLGREGSKYGIEEYLEVKYLCMGGIS